MKSILVVDDDESIRRMLVFALSVAGVDVHPARSGEEAARTLKDCLQEVGCAILDVEMPGLDGIGTACVLRHMNPHLPIAFMTGSPHVHDELKLMHPIDIFGVPFSVTDVVRVLKGALRT